MAKKGKVNYNHKVMQVQVRVVHTHTHSPGQFVQYFLLIAYPALCSQVCSEQAEKLMGINFAHLSSFCDPCHDPDPGVSDADGHRDGLTC